MNTKGDTDAKDEGKVGGKGTIVFEDDDEDDGVISDPQQTTNADKDADSKGHTFRKRRLTYTETHLADTLNSSQLAALVDIDAAEVNNDKNDHEDIKGTKDSENSLSQDPAPTSINNDDAADVTSSCKDEEAVEPTNDDDKDNSNHLEARILHASLPPIPTDCVKRRGSLLYAHHEDLDEDQQPHKKSRVLESDDNGDDDGDGDGDDESNIVEWKKKRCKSIHDPDDSLPFPRHIVGTYSCHGIEPVYDESDQNPDAAPFIAKINQDRGGVAFPYANNSRMAVFAVYDGHGDGGEHVSQYALHEIPRRLELHDDFIKGNYEKAFEEVFVSVDRDLAYEDDIEPQYSGCTACVAFLKDNVFHIANAGDSRAIMARRIMHNDTMVRQAFDLTIDQNPDSPGEQERIEQMGGFVSPPPEEGLSARVWLDCNYSRIGLAMSRSLGDHAVKSIGVIATPVVSKHELTESDEFMIIATDGVWEFMSSQEAVDIVSKHLDNGNGSSVACQKLIESAAGLWHENEGDYRDDITALVIKVQELWKN